MPVFCAESNFSYPTPVPGKISGVESKDPKLIADAKLFSKNIQTCM